jgi:7-cyano-7-deazaguanine synthase
MTSKAVVVLSGGLDSSTLAHHVAAQGYEVYGISFDYGQRHRKELKSACVVMNNIRGTEGHYNTDHQAVHKVIALGDAGVKDLFEGSDSSLVTGEDVPDGHYAEENMRATVVPNRNMMMISIAAAWAISIDAEGVWTGVHAGDHFIYPDCRPEFIRALNAAIVRGNAGFGHVAQWNEDSAVVPQDFVFTPFIEQDKNWIAQRAFDLGVDIAATWSCYKGGDVHCGKCGTCVERQEAIASTGNEDPTEYEDSEFWKTVTSNG